MIGKEFALLRKRLEKTQQQAARLLGVSQKSVQSYEQGWRVVPDHVAKQMLLLVTSLNDTGRRSKACWEMVACPSEKKENCPAWEFQKGNLCWFLNGTGCEESSRKSWGEKINHCRSCDVLADALNGTD